MLEELWVVWAFALMVGLAVAAAIVIGRTGRERLPTLSPHHAAGAAILGVIGWEVAILSARILPDPDRRDPAGARRGRAAVRALRPHPRRIRRSHGGRRGLRPSPARLGSHPCHRTMPRSHRPDDDESLAVRPEGRRRSVRGGPARALRTSHGPCRRRHLAVRAAPYAR